MRDLLANPAVPALLASSITDYSSRINWHQLNKYYEKLSASQTRTQAAAYQLRTSNIKRKPFRPCRQTAMWGLSVKEEKRSSWLNRGLRRQKESLRTCPIKQPGPSGTMATCSHRNSNWNFSLWPLTRTQTVVIWTMMGRTESGKKQTRWNWVVYIFNLPSPACSPPPFRQITLGDYTRPHFSSFFIYSGTFYHEGEAFLLVFLLLLS